jgi:Polyphosphate kinase
LEEARDTGLPLYERLKFLAIYSSNLDEFYKVRVAEYRNAAESGVSLPDISDPAAVLKQINTLVTEQLIEFSQIFEKRVAGGVARNNIILYEHNMPEHPDHQEFMKDYFYTEIIPFLQPVLLNRGTRSFLRDNRLYFAIKLLTKKEASQYRQR